MTKEKSKLNPEQLKIYNSPIYRKKIKKVVESIKTLRGIQHDAKLPGKPNKLKASATEKERETAAKVNNFRVDRDSAHFWAQTTETSFERRIQRSPGPSDQE